MTAIVSVAAMLTAPRGSISILMMVLTALMLIRLIRGVRGVLAGHSSKHIGGSEER